MSKQIAIGHGSPLANQFTSLSKASPAFQKVDTHEQAMSMYEEYLRRMLVKEHPPIVNAMTEIAELYVADEEIELTYGETDEQGHHEVIIKIIMEVVG